MAKFVATAIAHLCCIGRSWRVYHGPDWIGCGDDVVRVITYPRVLVRRRNG